MTDLKLYSYWETAGDVSAGKRWYYDLCWDTIRHHNPGATLLGPDDVRDILGEPPKAVRDAYITHRVDWIRKMVIHAMGGAWVDMDYVCWDDLSFLRQMAETFDYVGYKEWQGGHIDSFFAAKKGSKTLGNAAEYAIKNMSDKGRSMAWLGAATHAIEHALRNHPWEVRCILPTHIVTPVSCVATKFFTTSTTQESVDRYNALGCMSSVHSMGKFLGRHDRRSITSGTYGISRVIHRAFNGPRSSDSRHGAGGQRCPWENVRPTHIPWAFDSDNIGDHVQSLAASMLWDVEDSVDRDDPGSWPEDAVVPLTGWWNRAKFPARCRAVVVGFHCAEGGLQQVRDNAAWFGKMVEIQGFPAFCRDIFTRDLLRSLSIPAEFGGCVTLTLPKVPSPTSGPHVVVDAPGPEDGCVVLTSTIDQRDRSAPMAAMRAMARERLDVINGASQVTTSRLHVWLPALAAGVPVTLRAHGVGMPERFHGYNTNARCLRDLFYGA